MSAFYDKLANSWHKQNSLLCVGLDPDLQRLPANLAREPESILKFNIEIIEATAGWACAFKPQAAYYNAVGAERQLADTIDYIHKHYPDHVVILDSKRGDIGSTARMYAREAFERYRADAVTVNPFMGGDTLEPFLEYGEKGVLVLCKTSNPGSGDIQDLVSGQDPVYRHVARLAQSRWNGNRNIGLVTGATWPAVLGEIRKEAGDIPFLVPGIGSQGGDIEKVLEYGLAANGAGLVINASRSIIFAGSDNEYAAAAGAAAKSLCERINRDRDIARGVK